LTVISILGLPAVISAAPGDLDPTFGTGGRVVNRFGAMDPSFPFGRAVAIQPDGRIVVGQAAIVDPGLS
jgi:hypothetical protein